MSNIFSTLAQYFSYKFVLSALIVGALVSLCASLLGVTLVLRRRSMIGDGLSHVAFGALALATVLGFAPLAFSLPVVIIAAVLLLRVSENSRMGGDAAIAVISTTSVAVGVIAISLTSGMNTDVSSYMFGSLTAMEDGDVILSVILSVIVIAFYLIFFNRIFSVTFDEDFAKATGIHTEFYKTATAIVTAVTVAIGMRVIGAMLISALVIFPALSAMRVFGSFKKVTVCAAILSLVCAFLGICASCLFSLPTGAAIVASNAVAFCIFSLVGAISRSVSKG
ncbi:MAG: metal ABC transporter permease [Ruminococcaceae bacterium]|nr:metal ABC transporter permease [Oscillospiraceae bacterium]